MVTLVKVCDCVVTAIWFLWLACQLVVDCCFVVGLLVFHPMFNWPVIVHVSCHRLGQDSKEVVFKRSWWRWLVAPWWMTYLICNLCSGIVKIFHDGNDPTFTMMRLLIPSKEDPVAGTVSVDVLRPTSLCLLLVPVVVLWDTTRQLADPDSSMAVNWCTLDKWHGDEKQPETCQ